MIKLHIGCGPRDFGPEWIHIDGSTNYDHVQYHDIINLPFQDNSVSLIYASHVIEYFDRSEFEIVLSKWYNKLEHNGVLRLAVPDFESMSFLYTDKKISLDRFLGPLYGKMMMGDSFIYHKTVYDFDSLKNMLSKLNYKDIKKYDWRYTEHKDIDDHSQAYIPHMDKDNGTLISLNVECKKYEL